MPLNPPLSLEEINANRAKIGDPPLESPRAKDKEFARNYTTLAYDKLDRLRDEAQASHQFDQQVELVAIERRDGRLHTVSSSRGAEWEAMYAIAYDIMFHYGLHLNLLEDEGNDDLEGFYRHTENCLEYNDGYIRRRVFKRQRGR